ncbi:MULTISPECIES: DUF92 domain-containing protein [unclassified Paenibacillus]|uniref:DUF92 domain-containing protein n=1 Tax=unclassified Paenibacillus TaxID=185978 RepID=UPI001AE641E3|nr:MULTISPECIES: DUF92 domain-containing protein [unclassified Paenibacillus]MBP1154734.1 uncharacterized protein (TIGR00297 family) [Paenibacillus sp. PvP091]MBP1169882.1 uncharacterized protein (TIGR00297 family) [Paenibacillus sp. PvR098]MBP2440910.1 uncharacterized protein (TIGR00297 family) [Paenibacillus sp. PvP052]
MAELLAGLVGSMLIAGVAYWKKSLSITGLGAAVLLGTLMYAAGSLPWFGTLIVFFITSSALSKWKSRRKAAAESVYAKSGRRDAGQVLANGGLGLALCIGHWLIPHPIWWAAFVGVMATVTADTWATEIGGVSRTAPRSIVSLRIVEPGTSGGVTPLGLAASAAGGLFIGGTAWLLTLLSPQAFHGDAGSAAALCAIGLGGGLAGSLADSWLGAVCQVMYRCRVCGKEMEKNRHCEAAAVRIRGHEVMTNDTVNALSSLIGGVISLVLWLWIV